MDSAERETIERLAAYLEEAHENDRETIVDGADHCGDGREGCSYCDAIEHAAMILRRDTRETSAGR